MIIEKIFSDYEREEKLYSVLMSEKELDLLQREFSRQEQAILKELIKATDGFRRIPAGASNLSARDLVRLRKLSLASNSETPLMKDLIQTFNNEEGKQLLKKMGLEKTAAGIERMSEKYGNDALAERFKQRQYRTNQKILQAKQRKKVLERLDDRRDRAMDRIRKNDTTLRKIRDLSDKVNKDYWSLPYGEDRIAKEKLSRLTKLYKSRNERLTSPIQNKYDSLIQKAEAKYPKITAGDVVPKSMINVKSRAENSWKTSMDFDKLHKGKLSKEDRELKRKFAEHTQKRDGTSIRRDDRDFARQYLDPTTGSELHTSPGSSPYTMGHEAGHIRAHHTETGRLVRDPGTMTNLMDEAFASSHAISRGDLLGASKEQRKRGLEDLGHAYNTYAMNAENKLLNEFAKRYYI